MHSSRQARALAGDAATDQPAHQCRQVRSPFDGDQTRMIVVCNGHPSSCATSNAAASIDGAPPYCGRPASAGWRSPAGTLPSTGHPSSQASITDGARRNAAQPPAATSVDTARHRQAGPDASAPRLLDDGGGSCAELDVRCGWRAFTAAWERHVRDIGLDRTRLTQAAHSRTGASVRQRHETAWHKAAPRLPV